jgi:hypothetical protein
MENYLSQIVVMNVYRREREGKYLKKLIDISAKPYGIPVQISMDDGSLGVWKNFCQTLTMGGGLEDKPFRMVVQDDVSFDRNILPKIQHILKYAPKDKIIVLYNPTNTDYLECHKQGKHVLATDINFWLQAAIYPNSFTKEFVETMDIQAKEERNDDDRLSAYLQVRKEKLFAIVPSLIQHYGAFRSNFKVSGAVGGVIRNSSTYDNQFDVESVDWEAEFKDPFIAKLRKDYAKVVMKEEFLKEWGKF